MAVCVKMGTMPDLLPADCITLPEIIKIQSTDGHWLRLHCSFPAPSGESRRQIFSLMNQSKQGERTPITFDRFIRGVVALLLVVGIGALIYYLSAVLLPFFVAWMAAYLLYPIVRFLQKYCYVRNRLAAIAITLLLTCGTLGGFFYLVRPLLKLLTLPIGCLTMGLFSLALDTGAIYLMSVYLPGFSLDGPEWALAIAAILMILRCPVLR